MHIVINRDRFIQSIQHVTKAISSRTTIPILTGIKLIATSEGLTLTGSDSDISIESFIPLKEDGDSFVEVKHEGGIVLQAKVFPDIIKKLPADEVEMIVNEQFMTTLRSGTAVFHLNGFDPDEYPRLPQLDESDVIQLPQDLLKEIIKQTSFAVSTQETRPVLTGVNFELEEEELICTATDSHRLAMRKANVEKNEQQFSFTNIVIPGKSLDELNKIIEDVNDPIELIVTESQVLFKMKNLLFFSRLLDGKYPVTKNMFPKQSKTDFTIETKVFLQVLERALLLSREGKNNVVNLKTLSDGMIEITSITPEIGKVTEEIKTLTLNGEELRISFNGKNVIEALRVIHSEEVHIMFTGAMSPFVIRPVEHDKSLHLFSPVRTY